MIGCDKVHEDTFMFNLDGKLFANIDLLRKALWHLILAVDPRDSDERPVLHQRAVDFLFEAFQPFVLQGQQQTSSKEHKHDCCQTDHVVKFIMDRDKLYHMCLEVPRRAPDSGYLLRQLIRSPSSLFRRSL